MAHSIRHLSTSDIPAVAEMYCRVFLRDAEVASSQRAVETSFKEVFFDNPWYSKDLSSLVCLDDAGRIIGFLGMTPRPMLFKGQAIRAAVSVHFMVAPGTKAQLTGVQLLKEFFSGPQDLSFTDGANHRGREIWEGFGGVTVPGYSFQWTRVLRPAEFGLSRVVRKVPWLSWLQLATSPVCRLSDMYLARRMPYRFSMPPHQVEPADLRAEGLSAGILDASADDALRPDYDVASVKWLLDRASQIHHLGTLSRVAVTGRGSNLLGWYLYYSQPKGLGRVLQIAARRHAFPAVFDHLCRHALDAGNTALTGRVEPKYLSVLADRYCTFSSGDPWFQAHSKNREVLQAILSGDAFLTPLDGEWCTSYRG
jgi:hypothetical protein